MQSPPLSVVLAPKGKRGVATPIAALELVVRGEKTLQQLYENPNYPYPPPEGWLPALWKPTRNLVFERQGQWIGEHCLPANDIRQDLVQKWRKKGNEDILDEWLVAGAKALRTHDGDFERDPAELVGLVDEVPEHLLRQPSREGAGSEGGEEVGVGWGQEPTNGVGAFGDGVHGVSRPRRFGHGCEDVAQAGGVKGHSDSHGKAWGLRGPKATSITHGQSDGQWPDCSAGNHVSSDGSRGSSTSSGSCSSKAPRSGESLVNQGGFQYASTPMSGRHCSFPEYQSRGKVASEKGQNVFL